MDRSSFPNFGFYGRDVHSSLVMVALLVAGGNFSRSSAKAAAQRPFH